jgi:predicted nucleic acid-binding protein
MAMAGAGEDNADVQGPMRDLFIALHASVSGLRVLTHDPTRDRNHFPRQEIFSS